MKFSTVLAVTAAVALPTRATPLGPRQGPALVTATLFAGYDGPEGTTPAETLTLTAPGTTWFRAAGYAQLCAVTHDAACAAYALLDGQPNIDAGHPAAGARERPLFIRPAPAFEYRICVSQEGSTTLPDGSTRTDAWKVRGVRLECPGRSAVAAAAVAARAPPAPGPASVERMGNTFFVHYDGTS